MSRITEKKRIKIHADCIENPVCLSWRNRGGGWDVWVFEGNQKVNFDVSEAIIFERFIDELSTTSTINDYLSKKANFEMLLSWDNLEISDIKGLETMLSSPRVRMLVSAAGVYPPIWITVLIPAAKFTTRETAYQRYSMDSFAIKLPETLLQSQ